MVKVSCDGCKAPYEVEERRIPVAGLKMRCPKCGASLLVTLPGQGDAESDLPAVSRAIPAAAPRRAPPAPPRPAAPPPLTLDDDLPAVSPAAGRPPTRPTSEAFGEIDLMVDLPSPSDALSELDADDLPVVGGGDSLFDDLPAPKAARGAAAPELGELDPGLEADLPVVWGGSADAELPALFDGAAKQDLPKNHGAGVASPTARLPLEDESDLPVVHGDELRAVPAGKPAAAGPRKTRSFGDLDLPSLGEAAPPPPGRAAPPPRPPPPGTTSLGFGDIDLLDDGGALPVPTDIGLPALGGGSGLPAVSGSALPAVSGSALPAVSAGALPAVSAGGLPTVSSGALPAVGSELPALGQGSLPASAPGTLLPTPSSRDPFADSEEFALDGGDDSSAASARGGHDPAERFAGEQPLDLGSIELDASPADVGDEADLSGGIAMAPVAPTPRAEAVEEGASAKPKRSSVRRVVLVAGVLVAVGGSALSLLPDIGPFGYNFVSDRLNATSNEGALAGVREAVQVELDADTSAAAARAIDLSSAAHDASPRYRPMLAYAAYVKLARSLRFGRRIQDEVAAKDLIERASAIPSEALDLAVAAQSASQGQLARARQSVAALAERHPSDADVAVLAAEIELGAKAHGPAITAFRRAVEVRRSARTLFGLARALVAAGDRPGAEQSARAALEASPQHVGARTLIAQLTWERGDRETSAIELIEQATRPGDIRAAASDPELVEALTLLGRIHLARSRISAAEQAFAEALKLDPQAVEALIGNGELLYRSGRHSEAHARFEAGIRADPDNIIAKVGAAKTWLALERVKEAKDLLKKLSEARAGDPLVAVWLGRVEEALGNKKEAEAAYLDGIRGPDDRREVVDAYVALAALLGGIGRPEDAATRLAEASKRFPGLPALSKARGEIALQTGRYDDARREFEAALAGEDDLSVRFKLGVALRRARLFDDATRVLDEVAGVDKDFPGLALERGLLFEETSQSERALEMYAAALRTAPDDVDLKLRVGSTQVISGHAVQAEPILREVLKDRPNSAEANHFLGRALLVKGTALNEAMRFLERAAELDPHRAEYHLYVGWAANDAGRPDRAETALRKSIELDQGLGDAYWQRGVLLQKQGATLDALMDLKTALAKRPSRFEAYATMALCHQDQGQWREAEEAWRRAIAANGKVAEWHYRLGKIYASRGHRGGAGPSLASAIELAEAEGKTLPWVFDAHFLLAEASRAAGERDAAIKHYRRFLETAPTENAYRADAEKALEGLGAPKLR